LKIFVILDKVSHHVGVFDFFGQNWVHHIHVAQDFQKVTDSCCLTDNVEDLDDPLSI
jgi:hypothetical protein